MSDLIKARIVHVGNAHLDAMFAANEEAAEQGEDIVMVLSFSSKADCKAALMDGRCEYSMAWEASPPDELEAKS